LARYVDLLDCYDYGTSTGERELAACAMLLVSGLDHFLDGRACREMLVAQMHA
jgi:hypothetical protein